MPATRAVCYSCTGRLVLKGGCWWIVRSEIDRTNYEYHLCLPCYKFWYGRAEGGAYDYD